MRITVGIVLVLVLCSCSQTVNRGDWLDMAMDGEPYDNAEKLIVRNEK